MMAMNYGITVVVHSSILSLLLLEDLARKANEQTIDTNKY